MNMFKNISLTSVFLITLGVTQLSEGAQPACRAGVTREAVYTTPIHVTLQQEGNKYVYSSSYEKTILFTGKRGEEIAIGGKAARVDNAKALKELKYLHMIPQHREDDQVWDVVVIEYNDPKQQKEQCTIL